MVSIKGYHGQHASVSVRGMSPPCSFFKNDGGVCGSVGLRSMEVWDMSSRNGLLDISAVE